MQENNNKDLENKKRIARKFNIYEGVNVSVNQLNKLIIVVLIVLAVVIFLFANSENGLTVSFDTNGGSRIEDAKYMYGELIDEPKPPVKEGYEFVGWYKDINGFYLWDFDVGIEQTMTLYAFYIEK